MAACPHSRLCAVCWTPGAVGEPPLTDLRQLDTVRLIPSRYSIPDVSVLTRLAPDDATLAAIFDLDNATNDRLQAEANLLPGIGIDELVFGVPHYRIINAAFSHANPLGSRFNGPDRGVWYAGVSIDTSLAEVIFHKTVALAEVNWFYDDISYDAYLADLASQFHDLRGQPDYAECLAPDSYVASQSLAERLLNAGSAGLIYPSVRHAGGTCIACFRPAIVAHVRKHQRLRLTWSGTETPAITTETTY
jgi:RES domain-containing protein